MTTLPFPDLAGAYDQARLRTNAPRPPRAASVRATDLNRCTRLLAYHYHGAQRAVVDAKPTRDLPLWEGLLHERDVLDVLEGVPDVEIGDFQFPVQTRCGGVVVSGKIDAMVADPRVVVEVKSVENYAELVALQAPRESDVLQCEAYMRGMQAKGAVIIYKERATGRTKQFTLTPDHDRWARLDAKLATVKASTRPEDVGRELSGQCQNCPFRHACLQGVYEVLS